ncbi:MAG: hypothetical protein LBG58_14960, partial [Planctomycetaceae bacterium]|nr:hypothetical protein [Planctomycetaceae bacterium]
SKHKPEKGTKQVSADWHIAILFLKYPEKSWTSDELAAKIGCSGAAVRKTSMWKAYQKKKAKP